MHRRTDDEEARDRRIGASPLSDWSARRVALSWPVWWGMLLLLLALGTVLSDLVNHDLTELRIALTRSNVVGLLATAVIPPACLTLQWWRMRGRRHGRGA